MLIWGARSCSERETRLAIFDRLTLPPHIIFISLIRRPWADRPLAHALPRLSRKDSRHALTSNGRIRRRFVRALFCILSHSCFANSATLTFPPGVRFACNAARAPAPDHSAAG